MPSPKSSKTPKANTELVFDAIGTAWWIGIFEPIESDLRKQLEQLISDRIELFDKNYSRFRKDSLITQIAENPGTYELPDDSQKMLDFYKQLYISTCGLVTPLIGQVLSDAGYDAEYSLKPGVVSPAPKWEDVVNLDGRTFEAKVPILLDFGAAGKGYLVDIVSKILRENGIKKFCVDAGGDMYGQGLEDFNVGLENPDDSDQAIGVAQLATGALCGSSGNRRKWAGYHHIMNPITGESTNDVKAVWVVADEVMIADGLSTALFFVPPKDLNDFEFAYCLVTADNKVQHSENFPAEIFV